MDEKELILRAKRENLTIEWSYWVISARVQNRLLVNPHLLKHDVFCEEILRHEFKHTGKFTKKDFWIDMVDGSIIDTLKFCFMYPRAFARFIPIAWYKKELHVDVNTLLVYLLIIILLSFIFIVGK